MKRLMLIVEGDSEEEFIKEVVAPYLFHFGIYDVRPVKIQTSPGHKGGGVNFDRLKNHILKILKSEKEVVVTTFVDFFRLPKKNFPNSDTCFEKNGSDAIIGCLEGAISKHINDPRFIPYIQKHEFEALLFSSNKGFEVVFGEKISQFTADIVAKYSNPEDINTSADGAPSKRLEAITPKYKKAAFGTLIAQNIGIEIILEKCPRFNNWMKNLIERTSD